ncbi:MAG: acetylxylan esterase [Planctomycetota bacterium]
MAPRKNNTTSITHKRFPENGTAPDSTGYPHYEAIARGNAAHRRRYERTLAARAQAAETLLTRGSSAARRTHLARLKPALAAAVGVLLLDEPDPVNAPIFLHAAALIPEGASLASPAALAPSSAVASVYTVPDAGLDGGALELFTLRSASFSGAGPVMLWLPRAGDCYTGAQSPAAAAREFGHALAVAGWQVVIPRLPAFEALSIPAAKRRLLEGSSAPGAIVAEAARALTALRQLPGLHPAAPVFVGGADVGGLAALILAGLDRRVAGAAVFELPPIGRSKVHDALSMPGFNAALTPLELAALPAPKAVWFGPGLDSVTNITLTKIYSKSGAKSKPCVVLDFGALCALLRPLAAQLRQTLTRTGGRVRAPGTGGRCVGAAPPPTRSFAITRPENRRRALAAWPQRQAFLRRECRALFGIPAPHRPLAVRQVGRTELRDATRLEFHLTTEPDCIVNVVWLRPRAQPLKGRAGDPPLPTVIHLPGSGSDVARVEERFGHEPVARGWNTFIIDGRVALYPFHPGIAEGRVMIGQSLHDILTATQWIFEQPGVDAARVGCMGVSQGGTHTWLLAALEPRIAAAAPVCGVCTYRSLIENVRDERYDAAWRSFLDSHSIYYFVPGILRCFEQQDLCALIAPRPLAIIGGDRDNCFPRDGMREAARELTDWYRAFGRPGNFQYIEFAGPHSMPPASRESAYRLFARTFAHETRKKS